MKPFIKRSSEPRRKKIDPNLLGAKSRRKLGKPDRRKQDHKEQREVRDPFGKI